MFLFIIQRTIPYSYVAWDTFSRFAFKSGAVMAHHAGFVAGFAGFTVHGCTGDSEDTST